MIKRPFEQWLAEDVEIEFGVSRTKDLATLTKWLTVPVIPLPQTIDTLRICLSEYVETWNEEELKIGFIVQLLAFINFNNMPHYKVFSQRLLKISEEKLHIETQGRVEWLVSTGKQTPRKPFFFLQEYKPETGATNDPLGQLLIAMIAAQEVNQTAEKPLYGIYIIGRLWFFVVLEGKEYAVSRAYDATQTDDLTAMVEILYGVKEYIHKELGLNTPVR
jgi:hypothetical protein